MEFFHQFLDFVLHIDKHLSEIVTEYHKVTYVILALIVFCETGLVVTPFLPGDSLLFAAGALAGIGLLNPVLLIGILFIAAFSGDNLNFAIGKFVGRKLLESRRKLINREYLEKTHVFYEKHGGKTVIIARFVPIIRTFAPFVAGLGSMTYKRFVTFSILGNLLWICSFTIAGYLLCNNQWVKDHFSLITLGIIGVSLLPVIIGLIRTKLSKN
ncbi:MAG: DedA family protein [Bacteroidia bacterium]